MSARIGMYIDGDCLIVPIQVELRSRTIDRLQTDILGKIHARRLQGAIIDLSGVGLLDTYQAQKLFNIGKMAGLLGATTVFTGLSAAIAISLIDLGFEPDDLLTALSLEKGIELLKSLTQDAPEKADASIPPDIEESLEQCPGRPSKDEICADD